MYGIWAADGPTPTVTCLRRKLSAIGLLQTRHHEAKKEAIAQMLRQRVWYIAYYKYH